MTRDPNTGKLQGDKLDTSIIKTYLNSSFAPALSQMFQQHVENVSAS